MIDSGKSLNVDTLINKYTCLNRPWWHTLCVSDPNTWQIEARDSGVRVYPQINKHQALGQPKLHKTRPKTKTANVHGLPGL